jgi:MoaA/NifB/PqqE/SkfB family radical SAM enzyme
LSTVAESIENGSLSGRLWMYANYHCNLACSYCLTESAPRAPRRELGPERMLGLVQEARELGFTGLGITGGEPFMLPYMAEVAASAARVLPLVVLSNGTLFTRRRLAELEPLAALPFHIQISLDSSRPDVNDGLRGPGNFAKVVEAIPRLVERGIGVRVATTVPDRETADLAEMERLCALHRELGVADEDHVVRPVVRRGRAATNDMGVTAGFDELEPELTITTEGAFSSPFAPTVHGGRLDTDLLVTRTTAPLRTPAETLVRIAEGRPARDDARLGII